MFERFSNRARKTMALSNLEAQRLNHEYIGTEHMLLGLLREGEGVGYRVLCALKVDPARARLEIEKLVKAGPEMISMGKLPQTPRAKKVVEEAIKASRELNHNYVGTEHLLLGLIREHDGVAAQVLKNLGVTLEAAKMQIQAFLTGSEVPTPSRNLFSPATPPGEPPQKRDPMFERFTDRARKTMALANQEAIRLNHEYIGTEHILLGMLKEGSGVAANALRNADIDLRQVRREVEKLFKEGPDTVKVAKWPLTPRARKVLEFAIEESRFLNHNYVGTEHLLIGLLHEHDGVAASVLMNLGLTIDKARHEVLLLLGQPGPAQPAPSDPAIPLPSEPPIIPPNAPGASAVELLDLNRRVARLEAAAGRSEREEHRNAGRTTSRFQIVIFLLIFWLALLTLAVSLLLLAPHKP